MQPGITLLVGTDPWLTRVVASGESQLGCPVLYVPEREQAWGQICRNSVVLVVLDSAGGQRDNLELCRRIRSLSGPLVMMLLPEGRAEDRIIGLEHGADDCLSRPFSPQELLARMRALLRRVAVSRQPEQLHSGDVTVDINRRQVFVAGREVELRGREFDLLLELVRRPGVVASRESLLRRVWGYQVPLAGDTLDVHVHRLRAKLGESGRQARYIETVKGVGFRFRAPSAGGEPTSAVTLPAVACQ